MSERELVAICATIIYAEADGPEKGPGYTPRQAVDLAMQIVAQATFATCVSLDKAMPARG